VQKHFKAIVEAADLPLVDNEKDDALTSCNTSDVSQEAKCILKAKFLKRETQ